MHTHVEAVKAMLGLKTDREFAHLFERRKSVRTVRLWKKGGMSGHAVRELNHICATRGVHLDHKLLSGLSLGVPKEPQDTRQDAA